MSDQINWIKSYGGFQNEAHSFPHLFLSQVIREFKSVAAFTHLVCVHTWVCMPWCVYGGQRTQSRFSLATICVLRLSLRLSRVAVGAFISRVTSLTHNQSFYSAFHVSAPPNPLHSVLCRTFRQGHSLAASCHKAAVECSALSGIFFKFFSQGAGFFS